ncbi:11-beta-hydroxysteroid dehydrogenase A-like [Impatiens glandulifera]|uniref:11-beta-hydroxysteroid dehydrogenase A-like n=1 Tax=Impatiens glandulifera TaxID=253017 RepID=UPI001FB1A181|nr:11-beta-hydroxysteroid dehydrogenase A-like [Impatiens glandulifera]
MDLINDLLNSFLPSIAISALHSFFPFYLIIKLFSYILSAFYSEDVAGKVVVVAGASSGIGEHVAYEYAIRGAYLVLAARREKSLRQVADVAILMGSPGVISVPTDLSKVEDCDRLINEAIKQFGRVDHLVNCAGVTPVCLFDEIPDMTKVAQVTDTNFWGYVYTTRFAIPHLKKTKGKIIVIASSASWLNVPRMSLYIASKAAVVSFYETLRVEVGSDIGITIVNPGLIESEMTKGKFMDENGHMIVDQDLRDVEMSIVPVEEVTKGAKSIVNSACRGDRYLVEPPWMVTTFVLKVFISEVLEWANRIFLLTRPGVPRTEALSKKILDVSGLKQCVYPESLLTPDIKRD